jgi:hypothetical protein
MRARGAVWVGRLVVAGTVLAALVTLLALGTGVSSEELGTSWQVLDLRALADDPVGSVWYLHIQPPVHNLVVGLVMASPLPAMGTLFVLYGLCLLVTGLLLHDLLVRRGLHPIVGGVVVAFALVNPSLLSTIHIGSYEVPVACMLVTLLWLVQRHLEAPATRWLVAIAVTLTVAALTRSLLHPVWVLAVLVGLWLVRPTDRRQVAASLLLPVVFIGGWMLKNEVVFGTPTLTSWLGFNLQRGVTALMDRDDVQAAVDDGAVSPIVLEDPWLPLDAYARWTEPCGDIHAHPVTSVAMRPPLDGGRPSVNYNDECFLPAYQQAQRDAFTLVRRDPGRYLATRAPSLLMSYRTSAVRPGRGSTWMDGIYDPLLAVHTVDVDMSDWNLPLLVTDSETMSIEVSFTLLVLSLLVVARAVVALVRLVRRGWRARRDWPAEELVWLLAASTVLLVIVGGDLVEFGENGRFRAMLDPLLVALPLAWIARAVQWRWFPAATPDVPENDEGPAPPERDRALSRSGSETGDVPETELSHRLV